MLKIFGARAQLMLYKEMCCRAVNNQWYWLWPQAVEAWPQPCPEWFILRANLPDQRFMRDKAAGSA